MEDVKPMKRNHDSSADGPAKKKNRDRDEEDKTVTFKILIPNIAVGAIIGKGGESMRALKTDHQCHLTMSKTGGIYPGTNERILTIKGAINNAVRLLRSIQERVHDKLKDVSIQMYEIDHLDFKDTNRGTEMKIVMPNTSAGLVIGKQGCTIKEIRENHGVNIQVHPKSGTIEAKTSLERVVVIANDDMDGLIAAAEQILHKVASDPEHMREITREEHTKMGTTAPGRPMTPPFQQYPGTPNQSSSIGMSSGYGYQPSPYNPSQPNSTARAPAQPYGQLPMAGSAELMPFLEQLQIVLRDSGFKDMAVNEVMSALHTLAKYNIMALGLGFGTATLAQMPPQHPQMGHQPGQMTQGFDFTSQGFQGWQR